MITEEQMMIAVARLREYEACDEGFPYCSEDELYEDLWKVAWWQFQGLSRRDAERAERAKDIDAEWLVSIGGWHEGDNGGDVGFYGIDIDRDEKWLSVSADTGFTSIVMESGLRSVSMRLTTRGQLIDLLNALRGGGA